MARSKRRAPQFRKGQIVSKKHRSGAIACYRVIGVRDAGTRLEVEELYLSARYVKRSTDPIAGFKLATERDHVKARAHAAEWNERAADE